MNIETKIYEGLWVAIKSNYQSKNYTGAILDSIYYISELIRDKSGLEADGVSLVGNAFSGNNPKIRINKLQTETEKNIQKGVCSILTGIYQSIRNPRSHEKYQDSELEADSIILFVNYLYTIIDDSKAQFTEDEFLKRVFDDNFVESDYYANLIVKEIPSRRKYDVLISVFKLRTNGNMKKLRYFFSALINKISEEELNDFYYFVSEEFRIESHEVAIRAAIQLLPIEQWMMISEVARLRIENIVLKSIKDGEYDNGIKNGSLGTWVNDKISYLTLKQEFIEVLYSKLYSFNTRSTKYVLFYFWNEISRLSGGKFDIRFVEFINASLKAGFRDVYESLAEVIDLDNQESIWTIEFEVAFKEYVNDADDDELPF